MQHGIPSDLWHLILRKRATRNVGWYLQENNKLESRYAEFSLERALSQIRNNPAWASFLSCCFLPILYWLCLCPRFVLSPVWSFRVVLLSVHQLGVSYHTLITRGLIVPKKQHPWSLGTRPAPCAHVCFSFTSFLFLSVLVLFFGCTYYASWAINSWKRCWHSRSLLLAMPRSILIRQGRGSEATLFFKKAS